MQLLVLVRGELKDKAFKETEVLLSLLAVGSAKRVYNVSPRAGLFNLRHNKTIMYRIVSIFLLEMDTTH